MWQSERLWKSSFYPNFGPQLCTNCFQNLTWGFFWHFEWSEGNIIKAEYQLWIFWKSPYFLKKSTLLQIGLRTFFFLESSLPIFLEFFMMIRHCKEKKCLQCIFRKSTIGLFLIQLTLCIVCPFRSLILICSVSVKKGNSFCFLVSLYARLDSHYKEWSHKRRRKQRKVHRWNLKSVYYIELKFKMYLL